MRYKDNRYGTILVIGVVLLTYLCAFVIPSDFQIAGTSITKWLFLGYMCFAYVLWIIVDKVTVVELGILFMIILYSFLSGSTQLLMLICYLFLYRMEKKGYRSFVLKFIYKWKLNYIALFMSIFYSLMKNSGGRFTFTAVMESNQSGLLILCACFIERRKNMFLSNILLILGMLTLSRNYLLSFVVFAVLNMKQFKKMVEKYSLYTKFSFVNIIVISSIVLFFMGMFYQKLYLSGKIYYSGEGIERIFSIFDLSNYYRFTANMYILEIMKDNPIFLFSGIADSNLYFSLERSIALRRGYRFTPIMPHNFFFSYLRIYGGFVILFIGLINKILIRILNKHNFCVFCAIMLYAIFLSAGFNLFYLYMTYFALIAYGE